MYIVVTYDISSDKRRNKIDKLLSSYGDRVNFSVFELDVKPHVYESIKDKLTLLMGKYDSVRMYRLDKTSSINSIELNEKLSNPFEKEVSYV